ncbi:hypothetical protein F0562_031492 [Nyssa sinensis]|uniref:Uncharacterized protein n=1 Tax=Nyssa sinensis TaxID=561372 RepID=A0A5J5ASA7_9ASTE|nr:hypothetical protein F0562_031492 [Nyssa sinensis]
MEDECGSGSVSDRSFAIPRSESKLMAGEKRSGTEFGEKAELARKRVKGRVFDSFLCSEKNKEVNKPFLSAKIGNSQDSEETVTMNSDVAQTRTGKDTLPLPVDLTPRPLDLNTKVCMANNLDSGDIPSSPNKLSSFGKRDVEHQVNFVTSRGFGWDLNSEDISSSLNQDPFYPYKKHEHLKTRDALECGSTTGPLEEKDSMILWKEMKQNGFLSSSHGGIPIPKPRGRKSKNDGLKKKMELAKREQVDRFAKIAAPSGLLTDLNPGIINHVRNSKQVHSIIEALVKSEKLENHKAGSKQGILTKSGTKEISDRKKDLENVTGSGVNQPSLSHEDGSLGILLGHRQRRGCTISLSDSVYLNSEQMGGDGDSSTIERSILGKSSPHCNPESEDDILALKLSSSTNMASENTSSLSNDESENLTSVSSLSVKAATVASQWLELLHQDIKGRLAALRRSKKRVQSVIHMELPFLMSREFLSESRE